MLWQKAIGAKIAAAGLSFVGSVTKNAADEGDWDTPAEALDVLSVASTGDLVVIAFSFDSDSDSSWSWNGMTFTELFDDTGAVSPGAFVGYRFVEAGDANPYVTGVSTGRWDGLSIVASVFSSVGAFVGTADDADNTGNPNPPALTASGDLWVITGHLDDDAVTDWAAPANYTLAGSEIGEGSGGDSSTVIAYRIETLSSDNPAGFTSSGDDRWAATTSAFTEA